MGGKKKRRRVRRVRRGRRTNPIRIAAVAVGAVLACVVIVCAVVFVADSIIGKRGSDQAAKKPQAGGRQEDGEEDGQEDRPVRETGEDQSGREMEEQPDKTAATLSIMGDSISTFQGYIPEGYYDFFPENGLVSDVDDTWWKRVLDEKGWTLCVNASSSGATCAGDSTGTDTPQCGCNEYRTGGLGGPDGTMPDVIIVYMGTNDFLQGIPLGDNDGTRPVPEGEVSLFGDAYTLMLDKLQAKYPSSRIYCCTIAQIGTYGTDTPFVEMVNGEGLTTADYSARIAQIAGNKNLPVIDLYTCGIAVENLHNTTADGVHPTPEGMEYIAKAVGKVLD